MMENDRIVKEFTTIASFFCREIHYKGLLSKSLCLSIIPFVGKFNMYLCSGRMVEKVLRIILKVLNSDSLITKEVD
jgi:hypothetical protein